MWITPLTSASTAPIVALQPILNPLGCQMTEQYSQQYQKLYPVFHQMGLSEFDAQECVMALLSQLSEQTLKNVCACFTPQASSLSA